MVREQSIAAVIRYRGLWSGKLGLGLRFTVVVAPFDVLREGLEFLRWEMSLGFRSIS